MRGNVAVIGGGFIGLHEAVLFAKKGFNVYIIDVNRNVINAINSKNEVALHIREKYIINNWRNVRDFIEATDQYSVINDSSIVVIAVNTPLKVTGAKLVEGLMNDEDIDYFIDFTPLHRAVDEMIRHLKPGTYINSLVTIYPGGTEKHIVDPLNKQGFKVGEDILVTYTPERLAPDNEKYTVEEIPRLLGYKDARSLRQGLKVYREILGLKIFPTELRIAELTKIHENAFRLLNIAFVQESFKKLYNDIIDMIELASTKPYGFMPFYPSPYAGGTCLVKDAIMYWYATKNELIKNALIINENSPKVFANYLVNKIKSKGYKRILFYGIGFKPGSKYYVSTELNPIERLIREIIALEPSLEIKVFDSKIPSKSDFKSEEHALQWADVVLYWDYKKLIKSI